MQQQSGQVNSVCQCNVDTNIHFFTSGGKFHNAGTCTASPLCPLFTDIGFVAAHGYGSRAYNPSSPQELVQWTYVQGQHTTESAIADSQNRRSMDSVPPRKDHLTVISHITILEPWGGHAYYGAMSLAGHILYTNAGAQNRLMQTLTEPNTDIAILTSPKYSVGGEWKDWASDNDELVTALSDEDKDLKYQNVETASS